jgi:DNA ligase-1
LYQDETTLDGELYNHEYHDDFNKIVSLCKKQKPTGEELAEAKEKVQFWAYDYPEKKGKFSERFTALKSVVDKLGNSSYKVVPTYEVKSEKELQDWHGKFLLEGYEGTIVRLDTTEYENKRSKSLLKYKDFIDEEFKIVGAEEGEGGRAGTIGYFIVELEDGKTCKSNVKGNFDFLKQVWKDHKLYIGTMATIKYFNRTPDGALRFPYVIKLNRAEYE